MIATSNYYVIPAQAGIQLQKSNPATQTKLTAYLVNALDSRLRGNDGFSIFRAF